MPTAKAPPQVLRPGRVQTPTQQARPPWEPEDAAKQRAEDAAQRDVAEGSPDVTDLTKDDDPMETTSEASQLQWDDSAT